MTPNNGSFILVSPTSCIIPLLSVSPGPDLAGIFFIYFLQ
nr:MAG TPA: hypothetical protein [Caudoviricetes sp.]